MAVNLVAAWDEIPSTALTEIVEWRKTGLWSDGVPSWASKFAAAIDTKAGSARFREELESWYVRKLEKAREPFAEVGEKLDPSRSGIAVSVEENNGKRHYVTYDHLRAAARVLGQTLQRPEAKAQIVAERELVDGATLWQIRWQSAYKGRPPAWLLLREMPAKDGKPGRMEALKFDGSVAKKVECTTGAREKYNPFDKVKYIAEPDRLKAISMLTEGSLKAGSALKDAYSRLADADLHERRCRQIWKIAADIHLTEDGAPGARIVRLRLDGADRRESDMVFRISLDGDVSSLEENHRYVPGGIEPQIRPRKMAEAIASKLVAGLNAGGTRLLAEALQTWGWTNVIGTAEADRVWAAVLAQA
jgi:hypothetical protein